MGVGRESGSAATRRVVVGQDGGGGGGADRGWEWGRIGEWGRR